MPNAQSGGYWIHYEVEGAGPSLLLHQGYGLAARDWYDLGYVEALKHDYRLILPDPLGQGESDKPHSKEAYTPDRRVADVLAVLDAVNVDRTHFWGYSMGGSIGFDFAVRRPDRLLSLILGGTSPRHSPPNVARAELLRQKGLQVFLESTETAMSPFPPSVDERFLATADPEALAAATLVERPGLEPHLRAINLPTLMYRGDKDNPQGDESARQAADTMPNATLVWLPGLNHVDGIVRSDLVLPHARAFLAGVLASAV
jgi:pimeloyl-ACP methyl ester carboxylesterase